MNEKGIKHFWPFEYYDYDLISAYINNKAKQGEAFEGIGIIFATYKRTTPGEYEYCIDFRDDIYTGTERCNDYVRQWNEKGWQYVDSYPSMGSFNQGTRIFRHRNEECTNENFDNNPVSIEECRKNMFRVIKSNGYARLAGGLLLIVMLLAAIITDSSLYMKILWSILLIIQLLDSDEFFNYIAIKKRQKQNYEYYNDSIRVEQYIDKIRIWRMSKLLIKLAFFIAMIVALACGTSIKHALIVLIIAALIVFASITWTNIKKRKEKIKYGESWDE